MKYLIKARMQSGEYGQYFYKIIEAKDTDELNEKIDEYFGNFYDDDDVEQLDHWTWLFHAGCVMVSVKESRPLDVDFLLKVLEI